MYLNHLEMKVKYEMMWWCSAAIELCRSNWFSLKLPPSFNLVSRFIKLLHDDLHPAYVEGKMSELTNHLKHMLRLQRVLVCLV